MMTLSKLLLLSALGTTQLQVNGQSVPDNRMSLHLLPTTVSPGGRCLDGSMAGYYFRKGSDPNLYVLFLKGGGACSGEEACRKRAMGPGGSSTMWDSFIHGDRLNSNDCSVNPDFCNATQVYVPYCTGDLHSGNNTAPSPKSWGLYFDGHANFAAIVNELQENHGLNQATKVLLSGGSAGGIGAFKNVDYLASRLPLATVKAAPKSGWYWPGALPGDLPEIFPPSNFAHFSNGTHGSEFNLTNAEFVHGQLWQDKGLIPTACLADHKPEEWFACESLHTLYRYIKAPLYIIMNQFDSQQLYSESQAGVPRVPVGSEETAKAKEYIAMYGEAMRASTAQVFNPAPLHRKTQPDGLFHPSCLSHSFRNDPKIQGYTYVPILGDWFFERYTLRNYHQLVENCPSPDDLPCNPLPGCAYSPPSSETCARQLASHGCLSKRTPNECRMCAKSHQNELAAASCTRDIVMNLCADLDEDEGEGERDVIENVHSIKACVHNFKASLQAALLKVRNAKERADLSKIRQQLRNLLQTAPSCVDRSLLIAFRDALQAISSDLSNMRDPATFNQVVLRAHSLIERSFP